MVLLPAKRVTDLLAYCFDKNFENNIQCNTKFSFYKNSIFLCILAFNLL